MTTTRVARIVRASRDAVYAALLDPGAVATWLPPGGMRGEVHAYDARPGGRLRISLTYEDPRRATEGKTSDATDTVEGRFVEVVPRERVAWAVAFASGDPSLAGEMRVTWALRDAPGGTEVTATCEGLPPGVRAEDNEEGSRASLANLARLLEP